MPKRLNVPWSHKSVLYHHFESSIQSSSEHFVPSARFQVPDVTEETMCDAGVADAQALNRVRVVPPPSDGQKIFQIDPMLQGYKYHLEYRYVSLASTAHFNMFPSFMLYINGCLKCQDPRS
jgi:hypothetical protein